MKSWKANRVIEVISPPPHTTRLAAGSHQGSTQLNVRYPIRDMTGIEFRIVGVVVEKRKRY